VYIGISTDLKYRLKTHYHKLKSNQHHNKHLQQSVNKHGIENFIFDILEYLPSNIDDSQLLTAEYHYQNKYNSTDKKNGYNILITDMSGKVRHTEEHKRHMSAILTGRKFTEKHCANIKRAQFEHPGKPHTDEFRRHMSELMKNRRLSEETKKKISIAKTNKPSPNKGKKLPCFSESRKQLISQRYKGGNNPGAIRVKDRNGNIYSTIGEAAVALGVCRTTAEKMLKNAVLERLS